MLKRKLCKLYKYSNTNVPRRFVTFYISALEILLLTDWLTYLNVKQESHAVARKPRDAAAVLFSLKFVDIIQYMFNISQASKARLQGPNYKKILRLSYDVINLRQR